MKKWSFLAAIAAVGVGGAATWGLGSFVYQKIFGGEELTLSQGTALMPENALMAGLIDLESGDLEANIESLNKLTKDEFGQGWKALNQELFNNPDITYEKDISPWLGQYLFCLIT
ncbi:MAG: DUF3352 domain-containing protein [Synechococcaceae cyanobacterium RL_1_2]|nr:DUF3352 domain-containing protein [Synechococcaceae cyanobacterium RL_1_2]